MTNCKACKGTNISKKFLEKGRWLGAYRYDLNKYGDLFEKREFNLGTDYYSSCDLLKVKCTECGYEEYKRIDNEIQM